MNANSKSLFTTKSGRKVFFYQFSEGDLRMSSIRRTHVAKKDMEILASLLPEFSATKFRYGIRFVRKQIGRKIYRISQRGTESANGAPYVSVDIKRKNILRLSTFRGFAEH